MIKVCGTCKYHCYESIDDGWICVNEESDNASVWTDYDDTCPDWEGDEDGNVS